MFDDLDKKLHEDTELKKYYQQEKLILEITELITKIMKKKGINKAKLAKLLNVGNSYVTQLLDGTSNMTLRTISDVFTVLEAEMVISVTPLDLGGYSNNEYSIINNTQFVAGLQESHAENYWVTKQERAAA